MRILALTMLAVLALAGCKQEIASAPPPPHQLTGSATGRYCGMNILEHTGPKGQIILAGSRLPIRSHPWFGR